MHADSRTVRIGLAALAVAAIAVFAAVKLIGGEDDSDEGGPVGLSQAELIEEADSFKHVAYWLGPQPEAEQYELVEADDGASIYIRYLTNGAQPGDPRADFLTVGTYLVPDALAALNRGAEESGGKVVHENGYSVLEGGVNRVHVVLDDQPDLQIEIYSPKTLEPLGLLKVGALRPLGS